MPTYMSYYLRYVGRQSVSLLEFTDAILQTRNNVSRSIWETDEIIHSNVREKRHLSRSNLTKRNNIMKNCHECKNRCSLIGTDIDIFILYSIPFAVLMRYYCQTFKNSFPSRNTFWTRLHRWGLRIFRSIEINSGKFLIIYVANFRS